MAAAAHYRQAGKLDPHFTIDGFLPTLHYADEADLQHLIEGLKSAEAAAAED